MIARAVTCACAISIAALAIEGCSGPLPAPPMTGHDESEAYSVVPYPPPPGRVEIIPLIPPSMKHAVWLDGEWLWKGQRWVWKQGRWEEPRAGEKYAPPATVFLADGALVHYAGTWKPAKKP